MKHLKTYENRNVKYNIGDYIFVKQPNDPSLNDTPIIISEIDYFNDTFMCDCKISDDHGDYDNGLEVYVWEENIIRKLTPEEIEELEKQQAAKKYNL